ncbi:hypothetical protein O0L34_g359 [Tuta absoluta]|nr:hypothetical protein O0L34_g359 [Tuta absoluta]
MESFKVLLIFALAVTMTVAQRPFYAGLQPIGYPSSVPNSLSNRFGESENYPIETRGDANFIKNVNQMPLDNRPFWYINSAAYDNVRRNPQTYPQRPSFFNTNNRLKRK